MMLELSGEKKIIGKGYALFVLPFVVQFLLLMALFSLLRQAELEVQEQIRAKAIIAQSYALSKLYYDAGVAMGGYSITKSPLFSDRFDKIVRQIPLDLQSLRELVGYEPMERAQLDRISAISKESLTILGDAKAAIDDNRVDVAQFRARHMYKEIRRLADQLQAELDGLSSDYRRVEGLGPEQQMRSRYTIKVFLLGWLFFDLFLAIALMSDFKRTVGRVFDRSRTGASELVSGNPNPQTNSVSRRNLPAFGSKTWQAKRARYGGKLAQKSRKFEGRRPRP